MKNLGPRCVIEYLDAKQKYMHLHVHTVDCTSVRICVNVGARNCAGLSTCLVFPVHSTPVFVHNTVDMDRWDAFVKTTDTTTSSELHE